MKASQGVFESEPQQLGAFVGARGFLEKDRPYLNGRYAEQIMLIL